MHMEFTINSNFLLQNSRSSINESRSGKGNMHILESGGTKPQETCRKSYNYITDSHTLIPAQVTDFELQWARGSTQSSTLASAWRHKMPWALIGREPSPSLIPRKIPASIWILVLALMCTHSLSVPQIIRSHSRLRCSKFADPSSGHIMPCIIVCAHVLQHNSLFPVKPRWTLANWFHY
jgi:hypothetical protein